MTSSSPAGSPASFPLTGHFSDADINELLGAMHGGHHESLLTGDAALPLSVIPSHETPGSSTTTTSVPEAPTNAPPPPSDLEEGREETLSSVGGDDADDAVSEKARAQARVERKRSREKQRRSDVNKQFNDLTALLKQIETEDLGDEGGVPQTFGANMNRVDLIARTIGVLQRMQEINRKRKQEMVDVNKQLEDMKKMAEDTAARLKEATLYQSQAQSKPVMMMVPMMVNPDAMGTGTPMAMSPFMPQAAFCQVPQGTAPASAAAMPVMPMGSFPPVMYNAMQQQQHTMQQQQPMTMSQQQPQQQPAGAAVMPTTTTTPSPPPQPQALPQKQAQQPSMSGGGSNLAHCA